MPNNILITPASASIQFSGSAANTIRLQVESSGSVAFYGNSGSLFGITDSLSGSLMSVNDISGLPILEVFSDDRVIMGTFNSNALVVTGSRVGIGVATPGSLLHVQGSVSASSFTGSLSGNITGNAATVTNGVYTTSTYSDPSWITSLAGSKISGNITGNAANITAYTINQNVGTSNSPSFVTITSTQATGTAPFTVSSTTAVTNLNADLLDGQHGSYYTTAGNLTGTIPSSVLGNSTLYVGTTAIALNRSSTSQTLTGVSVDGNAGTVTNGVYTNGSYADPTWITSLAGSKISGNISGNAGTATTLATARNINGVSFNGSADIYITRLYSSDDRIKAPSDDTAGYLTFGFTSWANNNTAPHADYLHLRSYTDSSGGSDNLVMFSRSGIGMRIWQQTWGSGTAYSSYKDVAWTDGTNASGTWSISISGNATTATTANNANAFGSYTADLQTVIGTGDYLLIRNQSATKISLASAASVASLISGQTMNISGTATNITAYTINQNLGTSNDVSHRTLGVNNTDSTVGYGLSLYNGAVAGQPTYGIFFGGTATFGTHGAVSADWATYFTMNNTANRGWIFRDMSTPSNVASINNAGRATFVSLGVNTAASTTNGEIRATNEITAYYSDARLKNFHGTILNAGAKVALLNGYYFTENETAKSLGYTNDKMQIGVSAQEVQAVLPEAVVPAPIDETYLTVKYEKLVPLLIEAIKELQAEVAELKSRVTT